jgi:hypothetical protein
MNRETLNKDKIIKILKEKYGYKNVTSLWIEEFYDVCDFGYEASDEEELAQDADNYFKGMGYDKL